MRKLYGGAAVLCALAVTAGHAAQAPQRSPQRFQSGVDLITIDVTAIDSRGRPVDDLRARDFAVKVDGKDRDVASAELVRIDRLEAPSASPIDALVSTNVNTAGGRRVVIAVDQTLIVPGSIVPLIRTASRFVDGLTARDHAALITFPEPGPRVNFTTDKSRVREAIARVVGQPGKGVTRAFNPALTESLEISAKERTFARTDVPPVEMWRSLGPMMRRVLERGTCRGLSAEELLLLENAETFKQCILELGNEAMMHAAEVRQDANISLRRLESFLTELMPIDGPKTMVLISAGLVVDDLTVLNEVARLAAAARTSIHVIAVDPERDRSETITGLPNGQSSLALQDRQLEMTGLETVADRTGGALYRAIGPAEGVFERISTELSAWYVVAVERQRGDPDRQRVDVEVRRRGVTVRSNRTFVATAAINASRSPDELLREAMSSPIGIPGIPLRLSTFTTRDASIEKQRLHLAAQIGQPGAPAGEYSVGYVVMDENDRVVASLGRRLTLGRPGSANEPLHFDTALGVDPGRYSIRFGVVDAEGRRGTVVHRVDIAGVSRDRVALSDLIVGNVPAEGQPMRPAVEPHITGGRIAGYVEIYPAGADSGGLTVTFEIAEGAASPPLTSMTLNVGASAGPDRLVASGAVEAGMLPGRYVARATIRRGADTLGVLARPFVLERSSPVLSAPDRRKAEFSPEMRRRTAAYVGTMVGSLANIVAQEDFVLDDPDRRVVSDFLLVRYPGTSRDLMTYRDVIRVNGAELPNRQARLTELFLTPFAMVRDRVAEISLAGEEHVPPMLNPIFAMAFLQGELQSRFEITIDDAGSEWPREVKAVAFTETARPTLLRAGVFGQLDIPARGIAWIEESTGRILQTELRLGSGRSTPKVVTKFTLDDRLQIMVPEEMRTENPGGFATYSNFRRFAVRTDSAVTPDQR